tara:strand:+ start:3509 stop:4726 length:1218 start_codon:yes stop_codon:yes gene_type:complete
MSNNTLILGLQWGDEGKGKIVDALSENVFAVCRFQGGHNAGHTIKVDGVQTVLHLIPSGVLHRSVKCLIGNGVVLSLEAIKKEIKGLEEFGVEIQNRLHISENCPLILPSHIKIDQVRDKDEFIGTTGRGIGPAYEDKVGRRAIRFGDLKDETLLRKKVSRLIKIHNKLLKHFYDSEPFSEDEILNNLLSYKDFAESFSINTTDLLMDWAEEGKEVLFEGAQGTFLDIDHGTYPYVTSSSTTIGGVSSGLGIGPKHINNVIGVVKAYATRVGEGPFTTELFDKDGDEIAKRGNEFGATTGRPRRCGWLDLVALKKAIFINSVDSLCITKADVLDTFENINVCIDYDGENPVYKSFEGWQEDTSQFSSYDELPQKLKDYIKFIEEFVNCKVSIISVGPSREQSIHL